MIVSKLTLISISLVLTNLNWKCPYSKVNINAYENITSSFPLNQETELFNRKYQFEQCECETKQGK